MQKLLKNLGSSLKKTALERRRQFRNRFLLHSYDQSNELLMLEKRRHQSLVEVKPFVGCTLAFRNNQTGNFEKKAYNEKKLLTYRMMNML